MNVFELFKESYGVGVVASKKQAKDPRYSHSLTVDVKPDTPKKNRKALGLTEATAQEKAAWLKIVQPYAERAAEALETNPKFILDQWALESGYKIPKNNNLGGLTKRGEKSGFREYDSLEEYTRDWVNQINKNWPDLKGVETMDDYVDVLQNKGEIGKYAREEEGKPTYRERLAGMRTGYVPSEEAPTVAVTPASDNADRKAELQKIIDDNKDRLGGIATQAGRDAYLELQRIKKAEKQAQSEREDARRTARSRQNAIATLQKEFQDAMERGDGKAMNDIMASVRGLGGSQAAQQVAQGTFEPTTVSVTPEKEEEKSYAEMSKEALPDSLSLKEKELEDAKEKLIAITPNGTQEEVAQAQADVDELERAVQYNKDVKAGKDVVGGVSTLSKDETDYLKAKQGALMQGKDDVTSIADDDLNRRRAEAYANQLEGEGKPKEADKARAEAARHEALRNEKLTKGITWGQGTLAQQEQQMKQWDKTKSEGGDPAQSWKGGTITDPAKLKDWQERNREADKLQKEKGQWDITKTVDDYKADVSSWGQEVQKAEAEKEPVDMSKVGTADPDDPFFQYDDAETPKVSPKPEPEPEKVEPDDISGDFNTTKQRQHYRDKYHPLTPAFMMDEPDKQAVIARERLKRKAGELMRTNPAEWSKLYGGDKLGKAIEKAEQDAYAKFDEPQTRQKPAPIVDKSTEYKPDRNANLANNQIGDAYGTLSEPKSPIGRATVSTTPRIGPGANANKQTFDAEKQKAERQAKIDQQNAERQAKIDQQKAEQAAKKAEQQAKQEARKAEDERKRQERQAEQERRVSGSTRTVGAPVGESAIFRAIMRK